MRRTSSAPAYITGIPWPWGEERSERVVLCCYMAEENVIIGNVIPSPVDCKGPQNLDLGFGVELQVRGVRM